MDDGHDGIDKVASSWTLRGWSPPWTCATVILRGLKSPSTWTYDSTTYRNHAKNLHVSIAFALSNYHLVYFLTLAWFTHSAAHTLRMFV